MSSLQRFLALLCPVILFLMGLANVIYEFASKSWHDWINKQLELFPDKAITAWWLLLMVIPLCIFFLWIDRLFHSSLLMLKTDSGQPLKIRESAVSRYIHDRLLTLPFIRKAQVRAVARGGALVLKVRVWVACRKPLDNIQDQVLNHLTENARQGFGVSKILPPELYFESVQVSKKDQPEPEETGPALGYSSPETGESKPADIFPNPPE